MDIQDTRTLILLRALEINPAITQMELARLLDISLGLVNIFIKRMVAIGYCKTVDVPKKRVQYIPTPEGLAEKAHLSCRYLDFSLRFYRNMRIHIKEILHSLESKGFQSVVVWGGGDLAEISYLSLRETRLALTAVVDDRQAGKLFFGCPITSSKSLNEFCYDVILFVSNDSSELKKIQNPDILQARERLVMVHDSLLMRQTGLTSARPNNAQMKVSSSRKDE